MKTELWDWPQYTAIIAVVLSLMYSAYDAAKDENPVICIIAGFLASGGLLTVLYFGGFFK